LTSEDVDELMYLNWMVEGTWDEIDNYTNYLKDGDQILARRRLIGR
jgi:hypothetical protein